MYQIEAFTIFKRGYILNSKLLVCDAYNDSELHQLLFNNSMYTLYTNQTTPLH